ncbi:DUF1801 domain-containing protein [Kaarinaea lacus]
MDKSVAQYIKSMPENRLEKARALHELIVQLFPEARLSMQYKMPTYHWRDNFIAWSNKKSYLSVYTCSRERIADFKQRYPEIPGSVGCLIFRDKGEFPLQALKKVIRNALSPGKAITDQEQAAVRNKR